MELLLDNARVVSPGQGNDALVNHFFHQVFLLAAKMKIAEMDEFQLFW